MRMVIVEDDWMEMEMAIDYITSHSRGVDVIKVRNVGEFLIRSQEFRDVDMVVMEHHLPLGAVRESEEATDAWFRTLFEQFPEMKAPWEHQRGGEVLARWMRKNGMQMPILFHTHSEEGWIAPDIREDQNVFFCEKSTDGGALPFAISLALQAK